MVKRKDYFPDKTTLKKGIVIGLLVFIVLIIAFNVDIAKQKDEPTLSDVTIDAVKQKDGSQPQLSAVTYDDVMDCEKRNGVCIEYTGYIAEQTKCEILNKGCYCNVIINSENCTSKIISLRPLDLNKDGKINIADAVKILLIVRDIDEGNRQPTEDELGMIDFDNDKDLDTEDAIKLLMLIRDGSLKINMPTGGLIVNSPSTVSFTIYNIFNDNITFDDNNFIKLKLMYGSSPKTLWSSKDLGGFTLKPGEQLTAVALITPSKYRNGRYPLLLKHEILGTGGEFIEGKLGSESIYIVIGG